MAAQNGAYRKINGVMYLLKPRDYVVNLTHDAVASSTVAGNINIDPSSPFILTDRFISDTADPALVAPGLQGQYDSFISVQDASNGYNWSNDFVPRTGFARDKSHGYHLDSEVIIAANTRFTVTVRNPAAAAAAGITTLVLQGYSLYPANQ